MHMKIKINNQWLIYLALFGLGVTIGDCLDFGYFILDNNISVIDALTLFITVGLTWYIATILEKQSKNEQQKSDLIVEQIDEIVNLLKEIDTLVHSKKTSFTEIVLKTHCIGLIKQNIFDFLKNNNNKRTIVSYESRFKESQKKLKRLLTDTPIDRTDLTKMSVKKDVVKYTDIQKKEIVTAMYSFKAELFKLKQFVTIK